MNIFDILKDNMNTIKINSSKQKPIWWHALKTPNLNVGLLVEGEIVEKTEKAVYLDLGDLGSGIIWGREYISSEKELDKLNKGDVVQAKITSLDNEKGFVELSMREADKETDWKWVKDVINNNETVIGKVVVANRGGLIIHVNNLQGFIPTSQMSSKYFPKVDDGDKEKILAELHKLIGSEISVKILDFNSREGKIIFSEKKVEDEKKEEVIKEKFPAGKIITGNLIKKLSSGAFLKLDDEVAGFIPLEEISWGDHREELEKLELEKSYQAKVIGTRGGDLKLSFKAIQEDPWFKKVGKYEDGQKIDGLVHKFIPSGVLIKMEDDLYGFIKISEPEDLEKMKEKLELGKNYNFIIDSINKEEKRVDLKL